MFRRFLNNTDYKSLLSKEHLDQIVRGDYSKLEEAERNAEMSLIEYLSENYEIEQELAKGKYVAEYDRRITFPVGAYFYIGEDIYEVIRSISGYQKPSTLKYWDEYIGQLPDNTRNYSQFDTYQLKEVVLFNNVAYICMEPNGYKFDNIRIPMLNGWQKIEASEWLPVEYDLWSVVLYQGDYYTLMTQDGFDNNHTPLDSDCWGMIAEYTPEYNEYQLSGHDYVVYEGEVFKPLLNVNSDTPEEHINIAKNDPRNQNVKRHLSRLAAYEITKLIAPNNVSVVRVKDYEDSMEWLKSASKLKINPQIPRKLDQEKLPVTDWQMATFQTKFDPNENPWLT